LELVSRWEADHDFFRDHYRVAEADEDGEGHQVWQEVNDARRLLWWFTEFLPYPAPSSIKGRFPDKESIQKALNLNAGVRVWVMNAKDVRPWVYDWDDLIKDLDDRQNVWGLACWPQYEKDYSLVSRRMWVRELYLKLGDDFWRGRLPPVVPYWVFPELDR
jgi:hypothetical protein